MLDPSEILKILNKNGVDFFSGVPDSILKKTSHFLEKKNIQNIVAANEGGAAAICMGYHLSTQKIPCLYLQNSGLGNAINPLASISHKKVYSIPMLILIGWRGAPGEKDESQHMVKGEITKNLLKNLNINYCILKEKSDFKKLKLLLRYSRLHKKPVACLIKKNTFFNKFEKRKQKKIKKNNLLTREIFITELLNSIKSSTKIIASTGFISRELYQIRKENNFKKGKDFYMVGGMGHSSSLSLGVSLKTKKDVICIDGDGALIMHMGSMINIAKFGKSNFKHILLNNFSHESVGGQSTNIDKLNFSQIIRGFGYKKYFKIDTEYNFKKIIKNFLKTKGPVFLEVKIKKGTLKNLIRPTNLELIKKNFIK